MSRIDNERNKLAIARMALHLPDKLPDSLIRKLEEDVEVLQALLADHARLEAIVEKLPKTKDGKSLIPFRDSIVYHERFIDDNDVMHGHPAIFVDGAWGVYGTPVSECWSSEKLARADALAATKQAEEGEGGSGDE